MKKLVILGCENSHADNFLKFIAETPEFAAEMQVIGVYSDEAEAAAKLNEKFGVPVMVSYDEAVGKVDGVLITARHGAHHYEYAKPYIAAGIPMFIDKPITTDVSEALKFMRELRDAGIRVTGGSTLRLAHEIQELATAHREEQGGKTVGGAVRAPLSLEEPYGGFWFYSQHLVEMVCEIFGRYPKAVRALEKGDQTVVLFRYDDYDVTGQYSQHSWQYFASRFAEKGTDAINVTSRGAEWYPIELGNILSLLNGGEQHMSYDDFISPVFIIDAIIRALDSGEEVAIEYEKV